MKPEPSPELIACPFCAGPAKIIDVFPHPEYGPEPKRVVCAALHEEPSRSCPGRFVGPETEAVAAWNTRAVSTLLVERDVVVAAADRLRDSIRKAGLKREPEVYEAVMAFDCARQALGGRDDG